MTPRFPDVHDLVPEPALAALAILDTALCVAARALRAARPDIDRAFHLGEDVALTAARIIVDECDALSYCLDDYRVRVRAQLRDHRRHDGDDQDWPF